MAPEAALDRHGRPALSAGGKSRGYRLVRPLSDPLGGTDINHGRHQIKMLEPEVPEVWWSRTYSLAAKV